LLPFSYIYGAGVALRNLLFDIGVLQAHRAGVPVVSIGNISVGGVGKTPFVELIARMLMQRGRKVAILSRGYKRKSAGTVVVSNGQILCAEADTAGDEPAQMAAKLGGAVVVVDEQRARAARYAEGRFGVDTIVLDDAFQHRYLHRDLNIVIVSADEIRKGDRLLPAGNRREPLRALSRADLIVVSQTEDENTLRAAEDSLRARFEKPVLAVRTRVSAFKNAHSGFSVDLKSLRGKKVVAFSGIGNPDAFGTTLTSMGLEIKKHFKFPDHHRFGSEDLKELEQALRGAGVEFLVTTEKDFTRLKGSVSDDRAFTERNPLFYVEIELEIIHGEDRLRHALARL
jgi:tetraacyldisaccharide 4'-kinase